ncbi:uncharacterized protein LOC132048860 [Lycium ferocissimum]|uniref:uncharacterized protein LOC132048860 n=1 Tax=Lycium ferocissimum TaxID=112874 RepID=UPI002814BC2C|nr:uncharacterized protein LOC132048860 [Lycium ferocissimum]
MIDKLLFWNIRSVNTQNAFQRLTDLHRRHHYAVIAIMEPFQEPEMIEEYRRRLGIQNAMVNVSKKIWLFWTEEWQAQVIVDSVQHVTLKLSHINLQYEAYVTAVYAKCSGAERQELWDSIGQVALNVHVPWIVGGDFNVILKPEEKLGGLPVHHSETAEFAHFVNNCGLLELKFSGSRYTWWNGRIEEDCIFKRLDRILANQEFMDLFPSGEVVYQIRHGSDHAPLYVVCDCQTEVFMEVVENNWCLDFTANPFIVFHAKMKKVKQALAVWSRETYGNIFQQISTMEDVIKVKELQFELNPSSLNREALHKAQADLNNYLCLEEVYWKQKSGMRWFKDGDRNTKFFHNYVKGRRRKLAVHTIQNRQGDWLNTNADIGQEAVSFYQHQFRQEATSGDYEMLKKIPKVITNA